MLGQPFMKRFGFQSVGAKGGGLSASLKRLDFHTHVELILNIPSGHIGVSNGNAQIIRNLFFETLDISVFGSRTQIMIEQDRVLCSELSNYFHGGNRRGMTARKTNDVLHTDHNHLG